MNRQDEPEAGPDPLWLPRGSVRALIAVGIVAMWAALESGVVGGEVGGAPDYVRALATSVAAGYGLLRRWESARGPLRGGTGEPPAGRSAPTPYGPEGEDRR